MEDGMSEVVGLGYVVVAAADVEAWKGFATDVLGLAVGTDRATEDDSDTLYLRTDERSWRLAVERGVDGGVRAIGLEVADRRALESLRAKLAAAGVAFDEAPELAGVRQVLEVIRATDPSGVPIEFFYGAQLASDHFLSPTGATFVTGLLGLGHAVLSVANADEAYEFYVNVLGFRVSDVLVAGPAKVYFTSPNRRHHSIAFVSLPDVKPGLQHIMLEVDSIDTVGGTFDFALDNAVTLKRGLGRHSNDRMLSFYCVSPSGLDIEYGCEGRQIDDTAHTTGRYNRASDWGHRPLAAAGNEADHPDI